MLLSYWPLIVTLIFNPELQVNGDVIARNKHRFAPNLRVLGGDDAVPHSAPYMAGLYIRHNDGNSTWPDFCGGTLITQNYVLTAAHCLEEIQEIKVILGAHNWRQQEPSQVRYVVNSSALTLHDDFALNATHKQYDIALIKLPSPVTYNQYIQPAKLPANDTEDYTGQTGRLYGWGFTAEPPKPYIKYLPSELKYADMVILAANKCPAQPQGYDGNVCVLTDNGKGLCSGDSGGPLVTNSVQIGITSWGTGFTCDIQHVPAYFTRVGGFLDWIKTHSDWTASYKSLGVPHGYKLGLL